MQSEKIVELAIKAGCKVDEYENHYFISKSMEISVKLVIPKATYLLQQIVKFIIGQLGL